MGIAALKSESDPFSNIPSEQRQNISKRLVAYVDASKERKWDKLYDLVSETGRGGANRKTFEAAMKSAHGTDFAQDPDLLEFKPDRTEKNDDGYDVYGCATDRFEGRVYSGVAVIHGVFEHDDWFFTGWTHTVIPIQACSALSDPRWQPFTRLKWNRPMDEIANFKSPGVPFHIETSH